jgi:hypothetical protein
MREFTGRALDGLFDGEWTVEDVEIVARAAAAAALVHEVMKEVGEEKATNIGIDEDKRVPVEAGTQVCDSWAQKE